MTSNDKRDVQQKLETIAGLYYRALFELRQLPSPQDPAYAFYTTTAARLEETIRGLGGMVIKPREGLGSPRETRPVVVDMDGQPLPDDTHAA